MEKVIRRKIMIRAKNMERAKYFANSTLYRKMSTFDYSPEKLISVKLNKSVGLAGGVPGYNVIYERYYTPRYKTGKKKGMLR